MCARSITKGGKSLFWGGGWQHGSDTQFFMGRGEGGWGGWLLMGKQNFVVFGKEEARERAMEAKFYTQSAGFLYLFVL